MVSSDSCCYSSAIRTAMVERGRRVVLDGQSKGEEKSELAMGIFRSQVSCTRAHHVAGNKDCIGSGSRQMKAITCGKWPGTRDLISSTTPLALDLDVHDCLLVRCHSTLIHLALDR